MKLLLGIALSLLALGLLRFGQRYRRLFSTEHLSELATQAQSIWLTMPSIPSATPFSAGAMPPSFQTSVGLIVVHTRQGRGIEVDFHVSVSLGQGALARGAASSLLAFLLDLPRIDPQRITVGHGVTVTHASFTLDEPEVQAFAAAAVALDEAALKGRFQRALAARNTLSVLAPTQAGASA